MHNLPRHKILLKRHSEHCPATICHVKVLDSVGTLVRGVKTPVPNVGKMKQWRGSYKSCSLLDGFIWPHLANIHRALGVYLPAVHDLRR